MLQWQVIRNTTLERKSDSSDWGPHQIHVNCLTPILPLQVFTRCTPFQSLWQEYTHPTDGQVWMQDINSQFEWWKQSSTRPPTTWVPSSSSSPPSPSPWRAFPTWSRNQSKTWDGMERVLTSPPMTSPYSASTFQAFLAVTSMDNPALLMWIPPSIFWIITGCSKLAPIVQISQELSQPFFKFVVMKKIVFVIPS